MDTDGYGKAMVTMMVELIGFLDAITMRGVFEFLVIINREGLNGKTLQYCDHYDYFPFRISTILIGIGNAG